MSQKSKAPLYKSTEIPPERSRADIDRLLKDFGVSTRAWLTKDNQDVLVFEWIVETPGGRRALNFEFRPPRVEQTKKVWNQKLSKLEPRIVQNDAIAYRLLLNYIKNKLEAVRLGMVTVEAEFMAQIKLNLPGGSSTTLGAEIVGLMVDRKLENALEYQEPRQAPRNITPQEVPSSE